MAKHATLSPSSAVRWMACPGSVVLATDSGRTSFAAAEGTVMHEMAAGVLQDGWENADRYVGTKVVQDGFDIVVTQDMADDVMLYVDEARQAIGIGNPDNATPWPFLVEVAVPIGHLTGEEGATGTADLVIVRKDEIEVRDAKFGRGVEVDAEDNPQLIMYALGVLEQLSEALDGIERVRLVIHQPRLAGPKEAVLTMDELDSWAGALSACADNVQQARDYHGQRHWDQMFLLPTNKGCKFCPAKAICPALREETLRSVMDDFEDLTVSAGADTLAADLQRVERVEAWCKAIRAEVERRLISGIPVPGYKLVAGRNGPRRWIDEDEAARELEAAIGPDAWKKSLISPTEAAKMKVEVAGLVTFNAGKPSVAPEGDRRPAITVDPSADDFTNLNEETDNV